MDQKSKTFGGNDQFELEAFALRLEAFIRAENHFVENDALVLSLNGAFGSGKSTFLEMWRSSILERRANGEGLPIPILLNAWESDHTDDALVSILAGIADAVGKQREQRAKEDAQKVKNALKDVVNFGIGIAGGIAKVSGIDPLAAAKYAEEKKKERTSDGESNALLELYEARRNALRDLKQVLREAFGGEDVKILILIDELDRCRPTYAIDYLEVMKHVFDIHGLAFVLAVDKEQIESSAKALFGSGLKFEEYYRKFAHRNVALPRPTHAHWRSLAEQYSRSILELAKDGFSRHCLMEIESNLDDIVMLSDRLRMHPRQFKEMFRILGHLVSGREANKGRLKWGFAAGSALMAALSILRPDLYQAIGSEEVPIEQLRGLFSVFDTDKREWWTLLVAAGYRRNDSRQTVLSQFIAAGMLSDEFKQPENKAQVLHFTKAWDHQYGLKYVYEKIEQLRTFAD